MRLTLSVSIKCFLDAQSGNHRSVRSWPLIPGNFQPFFCELRAQGTLEFVMLSSDSQFWLRVALSSFYYFLPSICCSGLCDSFVVFLFVWVWVAGRSIYVREEANSATVVGRAFPGFVGSQLIFYEVKPRGVSGSPVLGQPVSTARVWHWNDRTNLREESWFSVGGCSSLQLHSIKGPLSSAHPDPGVTSQAQLLCVTVGRAWVLTKEKGVGIVLYSWRSYPKVKGHWLE